MIKESSHDMYHLSLSVHTFYPLILWCDISGQNILRQNHLTNTVIQQKEKKKKKIEHNLRMEWNQEIPKAFPLLPISPCGIVDMHMFLALIIFKNILSCSLLIFILM